jgi:dTDP-4-dehydrorhamnose 3,5-epimerase
MSDFFEPSSYSGFRFNDPAFNINWPFDPKHISERDKNFLNFSDE